MLFILLVNMYIRLSIARRFSSLENPPFQKTGEQHQIINIWKPMNPWIEVSQVLNSAMLDANKCDEILYESVYP